MIANTPEEIADLINLSGVGTVIITVSAGERVDLFVGEVTPFGQTVKNWSGVKRNFVLHVLRDTRRAGYKKIFVYRNVCKESSSRIQSLFKALSPSAPVITTGQMAGKAVWWTWVKDGSGDIRAGQELCLHVDDRGEKDILYYRTLNGEFAGVHAVSPKKLSRYERGYFENMRVTVERATFVRSSSGEGGQCLMLAVDHKLADAFKGVKMDKRERSWNV